MPVFREGAHLPRLLTEVRSSVEQCSLPYELVLVDDGSPDDTWHVIAGEAKSCQALRALRLSRNFGKESALCAGLNKLSGFHFKGASDFKLMNRKAVDAWLKMHERNVFFRGMTVWMGFTTVQIPFEVVPRSVGQTTWSLVKRLKLALIGITAFSSFPLHLVTVAGVIFLTVSVLLGFETLYLKLAGHAVSGFATVILLELIIGSLLMISLGIIGEYLARIYEEVKGRPRYLVAESIEPSRGNTRQ
jgi:glycosyltransferase involved in cell wall biosynthesis